MRARFITVRLPGVALAAGLCALAVAGVALVVALTSSEGPTVVYLAGPSPGAPSTIAATEPATWAPPPTETPLVPSPTHPPAQVASTTAPAPVPPTPTPASPALSEELVRATAHSRFGACIASSYAAEFPSLRPVNYDTDRQWVAQYVENGSWDVAKRIPPAGGLGYVFHAWFNERDGSWLIFVAPAGCPQ